MILAASVAAWGLESPHVLAADALDDQAFEALVADCESHRVLGLLGACVRAGDLPTSERQHRVLDHRLQTWLAHSLRVERLLLDAAEVLDEADIAFRVLKGSALAHTVYPEPSQRVFGDVDLLVRSDDVSRAVDALTASLDVHRRVPELRPGFDRQFGKEVLLCTPTGRELDLHRTLVEGALGLTVHLSDLFDEPATFPLAGRELPTLAAPQQLLHACYSAALGDWPPRLGSLRDVVQIVEVRNPSIDRVLELARRWRGEAVVARAVTLSWTTLRPSVRPPLVAWAQAFRPSRADRRLLEAHLGPARAYTRHAAALLVLHGTGAKLRYLHAVALPQRAYLRARGLDTWGHARRAARRTAASRAGGTT